jgi:hypothetical protein
MSFPSTPDRTNSDQCLPWLDLMKAETGISFTTERIRTFVDDDRKDAPFIFGDGDEEPPVSRSAAPAGPRAKPSGSKEQSGGVHTSPPKRVGQLSSSFATPPNVSGILVISSSFRMFRFLCRMPPTGIVLLVGFLLFPRPLDVLLTLWAVETVPQLRETAADKAFG